MLSDRHLNLFYSYNRDNELIENNLTRALIVVLRMISDNTRERLLKELLSRQFSIIGIDSIPSFHDAEFALQAYMDNKVIKKCAQRYVIIIATDRFLEMNDLNTQNDQIAFAGEAYEGSIPDGWIYNSDLGYCFLLEVKVGTYPINPDQIYSHAIGWLEIPKEEVHNQVILLTWYDVLNAIKQVESNTSNQQENLILNNLKEFIGFFRYRLFQGFEFNDLLLPPDIFLLPESNYFGLDFTDLSDPPELHLSISN